MWFDTTQFHTSLFTFQSNCAEGLHFSAFHYIMVLVLPGAHKGRSVQLRGTAFESEHISVVIIANM